MASHDFVAYEQLGAIVIVLDPMGSIVFWNTACSELIGPLDTARGRAIWALAAVPRNPEQLLQELQSRPLTFRCTWTLATGDVRILELASSLVVGKEGKLELIVLSGLDVTGFVREVSERARFEDALRVSEERLLVSLRASPAVVFNQDLELRYTWIHNPKDPFIPDQVVGKTDSELLPARDAEPLMAIKRGVLESAKGVRKIMRTTVAGEELYYDLIVEPLHDSAGSVVGITCAAWDVTEQRQLEHEQRFLAEAGAILARATPDYERTLSELAGVAVRELAEWCLIDVIEAGEVRRLKVACSDPAQAALAKALENVSIERHRRHLMYDPIEHRQATLVTDVSAAYLESVAQSPEYLRLLRALEIRSFIAVPLIARDRLLGAFTLISSRDSRKYRETDLRFAEEFARVAALAMDNAQLYRSTQRAVAARDHIVGIVAHDLRNPLNMMMLYSDLLSATEVPPSVLGCADAIRRAARRMNRLIHDMLDVARVEAGALAIERAVLSTRTLLAEVMESQRAAAAELGVRISADVDEVVSDVVGDHGRLLQVFDNLIGNALKFTPRGGDIVIGVAQQPTELVFRVTDTGSGIPPEHLAHLFDRFWQASKTDRRGAGLGLAIVRGIIEAHGGRIWVESQVEHGTTFCFTLPLVAEVDAVQLAAT